MSAACFLARPLKSALDKGALALERAAARQTDWALLGIDRLLMRAKDALLAVELGAHLLGRLAHVDGALDSAALEVGADLLGLGRKVGRARLVGRLVRRRLGLAGHLLRSERDRVSATPGPSRRRRGRNAPS